MLANFNANVISETDFISRSTVLSLQQNDSVTLHTRYMSHTEKSSSYYWLSFKGFMYTSSQQLPVAWSVHATNNISAENSNCDPHSFDSCLKIGDITFNEVSVNVGQVWSSATNEAIIPIRGLYYVSYVLLYTECHLVASLLVNNVATSFIIKTTCGSFGYLATRERAILLNLEENDRLGLTVINGTVATFKISFVTSFSGILVYPL